MEKNNNILEKYIHGSINEEEYKELQQKIQDDSDRSIPNMLDECWQKDMNIHVMPPSAKERTRRRIDEEIKKDLRRMWLNPGAWCRRAGCSAPPPAHRPE